jgi:hypothetical protein
VWTPLQRSLLPVAHHGGVEGFNGSSTTRQLQQQQQHMMQHCQ